MNNHKKRKTGFTLLEMLVVIAIIGVLAGFLFPAISSSREKANSTKCRSNLKQIVMACNLFQQENRNYPILSNTTLDAELIPDFLESTEVFTCPTNRSGASYTYNTTLFASAESIDTIYASDAVIIRDSQARHNNAYLMGFADGHVERKKLLTGNDRWGNSGWGNWGNR